MLNVTHRISKHLRALFNILISQTFPPWIGDPILQICSLVSDPSSQEKQHSSWSKHSSSPASTTATRSSTHQAFAAHPECGSTTRVQFAEVLPCDPSLPQPPLAPCSSSYQIQDDGTDLQGCQWNRLDLPPSTSQTAPPQLEPSAQLPRQAS